MDAQRKQQRFWVRQECKCDYIQTSRHIYHSSCRCSMEFYPECRQDYIW